MDITSCKKLPNDIPAKQAAKEVDEKFKFG